MSKKEPGWDWIHESKAKRADTNDGHGSATSQTSDQLSVHPSLPTLGPS